MCALSSKCFRGNFSRTLIAVGWMTPVNFADTLMRRLSPHSGLGLAGVSLKLGSNELRHSILGAAAAFSSLGLRAGDRTLIGCQISPLSAVSILGAIHAGLVAVPVDE